MPAKTSVGPLVEALIAMRDTLYVHEFSWWAILAHSRNRSGRKLGGPAR